MVHFTNGVRALVMGSKRTTAMGVQLDLLGTRGRIIVGDHETRAWRSGEEEGPLTPVEVTWAQGIGGGLGQRLVPAVGHLIKVVRDGVPPDSPPRAARDVLEIIYGALQSQQQGMVPVKLRAGSQ